jgi:Protein of unknown function (DUF2786)
VAAQLSRYAVSTIAPRWSGQLLEMGASVWWSRDTDPVSARSTLVGHDLGSLIPLVVRVAHLLACLPPLERHNPLPGSAQPSRDRSVSTADERILARVRAMLAKAESTTFDAEAETFTAGAQALMARRASTQRCSPRVVARVLPQAARWPPDRHRPTLRSPEGAAPHAGRRAADEAALNAGHALNH